MNIVHDPKKGEFVVELGSYRAVLLYAKKGKLLDFYHIYVPDPFRSRGLAAKILIAAFEHAREAGRQVVPSCPFIKNDFLPRFSKYQELVKPGAFPFAPETRRQLKGSRPAA